MALFPASLMQGTTPVPSRCLVDCPWLSPCTGLLSAELSGRYSLSIVLFIDVIWLRLTVHTKQDRAQKFSVQAQARMPTDSDDSSARRQSRRIFALLLVTNDEREKSYKSYEKYYLHHPIVVANLGLPEIPPNLRSVAEEGIASLASQCQ